jgi:hypothetical protein
MEKTEGKIAEAAQNAGLEDHSDITDRLLRKKSVRTTFNLTEGAFEMLDSLSEYLEVSQKDLLGGAVESLEAILEEDGEEAIASAAEARKQHETMRKTVVLTQHTLDRFRKLARETSAPRDHLVELGIRSLEVVRKTQLSRERKAQAMIVDFIGQATELEKELEELLSDNHWAYKEFTLAITQIMEIPNRL